MAGPAAHRGCRLISPQDAFSPSYARARVRFLEGAAAAGMAITSHNHPLPGRDGETLAMDVALHGSPDAENLLIISSACHGAEDFAFMLQAKPGAYVFIANGDGDHREMGHGGGPCTLHNPSYDFNDDLIPLGASFWVRLVEQWLAAAAAAADTEMAAGAPR